MSIVADAFNQTNAMVNTFVASGYQALANEVSGAVYAGFTLYVMMMGFAYLRGSYHIHFTDMALRLLKAGIIITLALNWGIFSAWVYNSLQAIFDQLGKTLLSAMGGVPTSGNMIEAGFMKILSGVAALMSRVLGVPPNLSSLLSAIFLFIGGVLLYGYAAFILLFSKIAFATTVVLAPVFIPFAMFNATRDIFGSWVRTVAGFVVIPVLATSVIAFAMAILQNTLANAATGNVNLSDAGLIFIMCFCFYLIMAQVPHIASGMVGTIGVSGAGSMASMFMTPIARAVSGVALAQRWSRDRAALRFGYMVEKGKQKFKDRATKT